MKVCLYTKLENTVKNSGIGTAINQQKKALELSGVEYTTDLKDEFDIIHINTVSPDSLYIAKRMKSKGKQVVMHTHTTAEDFKDSFNFSNHIAPTLKSYLSYFYNQADVLISPSEYTRKTIRGYGIKKRIEVISNGVDTEKFIFSTQKRNEYRENYDLEGIIPFSVGHVFARKGVSTFITVANNFQNKFVWFGKIFLFLNSISVVESIKNAPENVLFTDYVHDVISAYCSGDIFFFPSKCENQGISILEAAACKRPILLRDIPTYNDWLIDEENCLKAGTEEEFIDQLNLLIEDKELRQKLANNAYKASREHSLEKIGEKLKYVYEGLT